MYSDRLTVISVSRLPSKAERDGQRHPDVRASERVRAGAAGERTHSLRL